MNLDATAPVEISTGIGFFDRMLEQVARHGGFALELRCRSDPRSTNTTPSRIARSRWANPGEALGDKIGIALRLCAAHGRGAGTGRDRPVRPAYTVFEGKFNRESVGGLPTELVPHVFRSLSESLRAAIHVSVRGENSHHMIEACFKGVGRALRQAFRIEGTDLPSSKGVL